MITELELRCKRKKIATGYPFKENIQSNRMLG